MRLEYHSEGDHAGVQWYPVLHRPWALVQWLRHAAKLPEDYVLMAEPDHIFRHIPPLWCAPSPELWLRGDAGHANSRL